MSLGDLTRPLARLTFNAAVARRPIRTVSVRSGPLTGYRLELDLRSEKAYWRGTYEADVQEALTRLVRPGAVVFDVGAHIGFFAVLSQTIAGPDGRVVAFEPNPAVADRLRRNLTLNDGAPASVVENAVAASSGHVELLPAVTSSEHSLRPAESRRDLTAAVRRVTVTTIDDVVAAGTPPPNVMKVDVEGLELQALEGALETLAVHRPALVCELHAWGDPQATLSLLDASGYSVTDLDGAEVVAAGIVAAIPTAGAVHVIAEPI